MVVLFSDNFEDGTFNAWTATPTNGLGSTITNVNTTSHTGARCAQSYTELNSAYAYASLTLVAQATLYVLAFMKISAGPVDVAELIRMGDASLNLAFLKIRGGANPYWEFSLRDQNISDWVVKDSPNFVLDPNHWYRLELGATVNANGSGCVYVDNQLLLSTTGIDTTEYGNITDVGVGILSTDWASPLTVNFDDVVMADQYIGEHAWMEITGNAVCG